MHPHVTLIRDALSSAKARNPRHPSSEKNGTSGRLQVLRPELYQLFLW